MFSVQKDRERVSVFLSGVLSMGASLLSCSGDLQREPLLQEKKICIWKQCAGARKPKEGPAFWGWRDTVGLAAPVGMCLSVCTRM